MKNTNKTKNVSMKQLAIIAIAAPLVAWMLSGVLNKSEVKSSTSTSIYLKSDAAKKSSRFMAQMEVMKAELEMSDEAKELNHNYR